jgi:hypothetical protein
MNEKPSGLITFDSFEDFAVGNRELIALSTAPISPRDNSQKKGATPDSV